MGKKIALVFFLIFAAVPLYSDRKIFKVTKESVNVREQPSLKSRIIGTLPQGEYVFTDSEKIINGWVPVKLEEGKTGYIKISVLKDVTPHGLVEYFKFYTNYFVENYLVVTFFILIVLGIILGLTKSVVIYRDYLDVVKCGSLILLPYILMLLFAKVIILFNSELLNKIFIGLIIVIEVILLISIVVGTYKDNRSIIKTFLALITKIPLTTLFVLLLLELFSPSDEKKKENKTDIFLILALITPLIYALVRHKVWIYRGEKTEEELKEASPEEIARTIKPKI